MRSKFIEINLIVCIGSLFVISVISPMTFGNNINLEIGNDLRPPATTDDGLMDSPWPMNCHDARRTGRSPYSTQDNPGLVRWTFNKQGIIESSPVIASDGTIYIGFSFDLIALYSNGTMKWKYHTGGIVSSVPALADDGTIYIGSRDERLHALYPNGTVKWRFDVGDDIWFSHPAIAADDTIYVGTVNGRLHAINPNGTEKWHFDATSDIWRSPAVASDDTVYITSHDTNIYALNPTNGSMLWTYNMGGWCGSPSVGDDDTVYVPNYDGYLYALYSNGTRKWRCEIGVGSDNTPVCAEDGTIYIGGDEFYAIYPNGTMKWIYDPGSDWYVDTDATVSAEGTIYFNVEHIKSDFVALYPDGSLRWRERIGNDMTFTSPAIDQNGTVYAGCCNKESQQTHGILYAYGDIDPNAPHPPDIDGPTNGHINTPYDYTFETTSPLNRDVYYSVEWGDGTKTNWRGPYSSGEVITLEYTWDKTGTYVIRARAKDSQGLWSNWGELEVEMPLSYSTISQRFSVGFPQVFPILKQFLQMR